MFHQSDVTVFFFLCSVTRHLTIYSGVMQLSSVVCFRGTCECPDTVLGSFLLATIFIGRFAGGSVT